jgi:hypothetical protein
MSSKNVTKVKEQQDRFEEEKKSDDVHGQALIDSNAVGTETAPDSVDRPHNDTSLDVSKNRSAKSRMAGIAGCLLHILLLDLPLIVAFGAYLALVGLERMATEYLIPQVELQVFTPEKAERGLTYYHRVCDASHQTAHDPTEFTIYPNMSTNEAVDVMLTHGVSVIPNLLTEKTATALRDFILAENAVAKDLLYVIENKNRWSFPIRVDQHPTVVAALEEMLNQERLVDILEAIAGKNPAVIEFTAITQAYGAKQQFWHQDGTKSCACVCVFLHECPVPLPHVLCNHVH